MSHSRIYSGEIGRVASLPREIFQALGAPGPSLLGTGEGGRVRPAIEHPIGFLPASPLSRPLRLNLHHSVHARLMFEWLGRENPCVEAFHPRSPKARDRGHPHCRLENLPGPWPPANESTTDLNNDCEFNSNESRVRFAAKRFTSLYSLLSQIPRLSADEYWKLWE